MNAQTKLPRGITTIGIFLLFGALMAFLAGTMLIWPGTALDRLWALNMRAYWQLAPFRNSAGVLFLALGAILSAAGIGWLRRRRWGLRLAAILFAAQVLGNLMNAFTGDIVRGGVGFIIAAALLIYILRSNVRALFVNADAPTAPSPR